MATKLVPLDFEHLATLDDGRIDRLLRMHVARAAQDDKSKRVVSLSIAVGPVVSERRICGGLVFLGKGNLCQYVLNFDVKRSCSMRPERKSRSSR